MKCRRARSAGGGGAGFLPVDGLGVDQCLEVGQVAVSHDFEAVRTDRLRVSQSRGVLAHVAHLSLE